ncbi:hypothetical protein [Brenneria izbisi]|uniref:Uncharacterized protein n=1 Tax=Brenneria izbisi TaxID=2939450 RepID=A0AA41Y2Z6_9GAMM|nr:hypothetical protein [Brenneria izbisi]MCV9878461.1 hypothetical protein [Brenneria izbisi]MCV9881884.1 hypothetical protein [Brenneria izbisi]
MTIIFPDDDEIVLSIALNYLFFIGCFPDNNKIGRQARWTTGRGDILAAAIGKKYLLAHSFALKAVLLPYA